MVAGIVIEHRKTINPKDDVVYSTEVDISAFVMLLKMKELNAELFSLTRIAIKLKMSN